MQASQKNFSSVDLCIPIYLNSNIVLDLLAIFEDGFSNVTEIRTSITEAKEKSHGLEAKVGASNLFALLGISGGGSLSARNAESGGLTAKTEKIHTPTSLFNKLRSLLDQRGLLKNLAENGANLLSIKSGDFLETNTILIKNPIMDTFQGLLQLMTFSLPFLGLPGLAWV